VITTNETARERVTPVQPPATPLFARSAGALAIAAGSLLVVGQLIWLPFDPEGNLATSLNHWFNAGTVAYFAGFVVLVFALIGVHGQQAARAGRFGTFGFAAALLGTIMLGGDLWFETFAVPWLADEAPNAFDTDPTIVLALGAVASYLLFAAGWVLYGIATLRAHAPVAISIAIIVGGALGYQALLSPWAVPLGLSVGSLGVWLIRTRPAAMP